MPTEPNELKAGPWLGYSLTVKSMVRESAKHVSDSQLVEIANAVAIHTEQAQRMQSKLIRIRDEYIANPTPEKQHEVMQAVERATDFQARVQPLFDLLDYAESIGRTPWRK